MEWYWILLTVIVYCLGLMAIVRWSPWLNPTRTSWEFAGFVTAFWVMWPAVLAIGIAWAVICLPFYGLIKLATLRKPTPNHN